MALTLMECDMVISDDEWAYWSEHVPGPQRLLSGLEGGAMSWEALQDPDDGGTRALSSVPNASSGPSLLAGFAVNACVAAHRTPLMRP